MTKKKITAKPAPGRAKARKQPTGPVAKPGTKLGQLEGMLRRPEGATIPQLAKTLGWQLHSVRGAIAGSLKKKLGLKVVTEKGNGRDRVYRIVS